MKKILFIILAAVICLSSTACGDTPVESNEVLANVTEESASISETTEEPTEPPTTTEKPTEAPTTTEEPTTEKPPITTEKPTEPPATTQEPTTEPPPPTTEAVEPSLALDPQKFANNVNNALIALDSNMRLEIPNDLIETAISVSLNTYNACVLGIDVEKKTYYIHYLYGDG